MKSSFREIRSLNVVRVIGGAIHRLFSFILPFSYPLGETIVGGGRSRAGLNLKIRNVRAVGK